MHSIVLGVVPAVVFVVGVSLLLWITGRDEHKRLKRSFADAALMFASYGRLFEESVRRRLERELEELQKILSKSCWVKLKKADDLVVKIQGTLCEEDILAKLKEVGTPLSV